MAKPKKAAAKRGTGAGAKGVRVYTVEVFLLQGPISAGFARKNPVVSRTIQIRGDQTLEDLHEAIFDAYDRFDEHMYEFQIGGKGPNDPAASRYVLPVAADGDDGGRPPAGQVDATTIDSLGLTTESQFGYWFDFGDDWWHQINVAAIEEGVPRGKYPQVVKWVGASPPQYLDEDDEEDEEDEEEE